MPADMTERTARRMYEYNMIPGDFHWEDLDDKAKAHWHKKAGKLLADLLDAQKKRALPEPPEVKP